MNAVKIAKFVAGIIADLLTEQPSPKTIAERLLDAAVATGHPENELASYLTKAAVQRQELLFQAAKAAKLAGKL